MSNEPDRDELHDRLLDQALRETLSGETPPDLSGEILAACADDAPESKSDAMNAPSPGRLRRVLIWAVAASVFFCLGALARPALDSARQSARLEPSDSAEQTETEFQQMLESMRQKFGASAENQPGNGNLERVVSKEQAKQALLKDSIRSAMEKKDANYSAKRDVDRNEKERAARTKAWIEDMAKVEKSHVPFPNEPPIVYPNEEYWREMTNRRKEYLPPNPSSRADVESQTQNERELLSRRLQEEKGKESQLIDRFAAVDLEDGLPSPTGSSHAQGWDKLYWSHSGASYRIQRVPPSFSSRGDTSSFSLSDDGRGRLGRDFGSTSASDSFGLVETETFAFHDRRVEDLEFKDFDEEGRGPVRSGDQYQRIYENPFMEAAGLQAVSTFSIDVDTASYSNVRQFLTSGRLPPPDAVRLEELINYFEYEYEGPTATQGLPPSPSPSPPGGGGQDVPFAAHVEVAGCPWAPEHRLVRIGVKGRELDVEKRPLSNLVFLIDVSGSMQDANKLPLVVEGMKALAQQLGENDRVAIVVYASSEGLVLPSTPGDQQETILAALDSLRAGGSTAGGAGIRLAYQIAEDNYIEGGTNRVILCTDGDFNVGAPSTGDLERLVSKRAKETSVFLSVCGFGRGNLNDAMMETISGKGNGAYYYIDSQREAERVFVKDLTGTLVTIAKDVKIQVEFNPAKVAGYRLLGYENRMLEAQDFSDDRKDAGEIGAGHTVTALYEIVPAGQQIPAPEIDELRYQKPPAPLDGDVAGEMLVLKMRYKQPDEDVSTKREWPVTDNGKPFGQASTDMQFAAGVAGFGMLLRDSQYRGKLTWDATLEIAQAATSPDPGGYRAEFLELVKQAKALSGVAESKTTEE